MMSAESNPELAPKPSTTTTTTPPTIPKVQKAWREVRRGDPKDALELREDVPVLATALTPGECLVKIKAAALNPGYVSPKDWGRGESDWHPGYRGPKMMKLLPNAVAKRPLTHGWDFAGEIAATQGVTGCVPASSIVASTVIHGVPGSRSVKRSLVGYQQVSLDHLDTFTMA